MNRRLLRILPIWLTTAAAAAAVVFVHFMISLPLHAAVLEPDLHLSFWELYEMCYLHAATTCQIATEVKLFLQLQSLRATVRRPQALDAVLALRRLLLQLVRMLMIREMIILIMAELLRQFVLAVTWRHLCTSRNNNNSNHNYHNTNNNNNIIHNNNNIRYSVESL